MGQDGLLTAAGFPPSKPAGQADMLKVVTGITKLDFAPGSQWAYSNTNYFLLGLVVARVSADSLAAFEQHRIFSQLGMTSTSLVDGSKTPGPGAVSYQFLPTLSFEETIWLRDVEGPGGIHTTVLDLLRWAGNFTSGVVGGEALLRAQLEAGPQPVTAVAAPDARYAAGLTIMSHAGTQLIWHNGAWEGFRAGLLVEPSLGRAVAVACNTDLAMDGYLLGLTVLDTWFGSAP
jgi:CubicO group peptidase (beta-lactamase class C family)